MMLSLAVAAALATTAHGATLRNVLMITVDGEHAPPSPHPTLLLTIQSSGFGWGAAQTCARS